MLPMRAPARRGRPGTPSGGGGGGGGDALLETVTLDNFSGASRTDPYVTFRRSFVQGEVPSGSRVEMRYGGSAIPLQQADARTLHGDGSLRHATFAAKVPAGAVADNGTIDVELWSITGSFSNSSTINRAVLTGSHDYKMRIRIGGVDYFCKLNNLDAAGTWRERRAGAAVRAWHHYGVFRAGEGAAASDQGQWQGHFYSYVWEDGRVCVWAQAINGRIINGASCTVEQMELLDGATSLRLHTTSFTAYGHSAFFLCNADGSPVWSSGHTDFWARVSARRLHDAKVLPYLHSTAAMRAAVPAPTVLTYAPQAADGDFYGGLNQGGGSAWIGICTAWSARVAICNDDGALGAPQRKALLVNDRMNALGQGLRGGWYLRHDSGHPPVLIPGDFTTDGLTASQETLWWGTQGDGTLADTGGAYPGKTDDASHGPTYGWLQAATTGWEWWIDACMTLASASLGAERSTTALYHRNPIINGTQHFGTCMVWLVGTRDNVWRMRNWSNAFWLLPDAHPCRNYVAQVWSNTLSAIDAYMTAPNYPAGWDALSPFPPFEENGYMFAPYQMGYQILVATQAVNRGQVATTHKWIRSVERQAFGALAACPYHYCSFFWMSFLAGPTQGGAAAQTWADAYGGVGKNTLATFTTRLVSDENGTSGACPASGFEPGDIASGYYGAGHKYPTIQHAAIEFGNLIGMPGATAALLTHMRQEETAGGVSEAAWGADMVQWRVRQPPA